MSTIDPKVVWPGWETVQLIGRGGFGAVYEIQRDVLGETEKAALKVITIPQNSSDIDELYGEGYDDESITSTFKSYLKSIVAEYSLMRKMNGSANVVNCDDVRYVQHEDGFGWDIFIKMELLTPLTKALGKTVMDSQAARIGADICKALILCKKHNIIHRDIKPANIFVSENGDYKLGDFGIAKTVEKTSGGTKIGTYEYMAPEVYHDQPYGATVDIYSLGMVLYWLLNERRTPFLKLPPELPTNSEKEQARKRRFSGEAIPAPAHGSAALQQIVLKACAYDPAARYQSAEEMLQALENLEFGMQNSESRSETTAPLEVHHDAPAAEDATVGVFGAAKAETPAPVGAHHDAPAAEPNAGAPDNTAGAGLAPARGYAANPKQTGGAYPERALSPSPTEEDDITVSDRDRLQRREEKQPGKKKTGLLVGCTAGAVLVLALLLLLLPKGGNKGGGTGVTPVPTAAPTLVPTPAPTAEPTPTQTPATSATLTGNYWTLENGVLTIRGSGQMPFYNGAEQPWEDRREEITAVILEDGVTSVGTNAFYGCSNLTSVQLPDSVTVISADAFYGCSSLPSIHIPESVTKIESAFMGCSSLTSLTIPASATTVEVFGLYQCASLREIHVNPGNTVYQSIDGVLFTADGKTLLCCPPGFPRASYTIPEGVTTIGTLAFDNCKQLADIAIPNGVTLIRDGAFSGCSSLLTLTIPEGVTTIGARAFSSCDKLTTVYIPASVTGLGEKAFLYSTLLKDVYYGGTEAQWNALAGNTELGFGSKAEIYCADAASAALGKHPSSDDIKDTGCDIEYPRESEYYENYVYATVVAPRGYGIYGYATADHSGKTFTVFHGEKVTILAERKGWVCVIIQSNNTARWVNKEHLEIQN